MVRAEAILISVLLGDGELCHWHGENDRVEFVYSAPIRVYC